MSEAALGDRNKIRIAFYCRGLRNTFSSDMPYNIGLSDEEDGFAVDKIGILEFLSLHFFIIVLTSDWSYVFPTFSSNNSAIRFKSVSLHIGGRPPPLNSPEMIRPFAWFVIRR